MALKLNGSTDGSVSLDAPADTSPTGTDVTLTLPTSAGSSGQYLQTNGSGTLSWQTVTDTGTTWTTLAEDANGETALLLENIPAEAEQIIIAYYDLSPNTTASMRIRLGTSSGIDSTSDYDMFRGIFGQSTGGGAQTTTFFGMENYTGAANQYNGTIFLTRNSTNGWSIMWNQFERTSDTLGICTGEKLLSSTLTQVQFFPSSGSFDDGTVRFKYLT